jgi:hypothetical protein
MLLRMAPSIRDAMLQDGEFRRQLHFVMPATLELGEFSVARSVVFNTLRTAGSADHTGVISDLDGVEHTCLVSAHGTHAVSVRLAEASFIFDVAQVLSGERDVRLNALASALLEFPIESRRVDHWIQITSNCPLSDDQYLLLLDEIDLSAVRQLNRVEAEFAKGSLDLYVILPEQLASWHSILAPLSASKEWSQFSTAELFVERDALIRRQAASGLSLIGPSAILMDVDFIRTLRDLPDTDLLEATEGLADHTDPYSLALAFDIAVQNCQNVEFVSLGSKVLDKLIGSHASERMFQDFSSAIKCTLAAFGEYKAVEGMPPYYVRLLAWTWAGHLCRRLNDIQYDRAQFLSLLEKGPGFRVLWAGVSRRHENPFWRAEWLSPEDLKGLLFRRIMQSCDGAGGELPPEWLALIAQSELARSGTKTAVHRFMPGPMDNFSGDWQGRMACPEDVRVTIIDIVRDTHPSKLLDSLFIFVATFEDFPEVSDAIDKTCEYLIANHDVEIAHAAYQTLGHFCGLKRSSRLAENAANLIFSRVCGKPGLSSIEASYYILDCSAAYENEADRIEYLRHNFERLAFFDLTKEAAQQCISIIDIVCGTSKALKIGLSRARSVFKLCC